MGSCGHIAYMCERLWKPKVGAIYLPQLLCYLFLWNGLRPHWFGWTGSPVNARDCSVPPSLTSPQHTSCTPLHLFKRGCWGSNPGPCPSLVSTLLSEPSSQALSFTLTFICISSTSQPSLFFLFCLHWRRNQKLTIQHPPLWELQSRKTWKFGDGEENLEM